MTIKDLWASCSQWNHYFDRLFEKNVKYWKKCKINLFLTIDPNREMNSKIFSAFCILLLLQIIALTVPGEKNMISGNHHSYIWWLPISLLVSFALYDVFLCANWSLISYDGCWVSYIKFTLYKETAMQQKIDMPCDSIRKVIHVSTQNNTCIYTELKLHIYRELFWHYLFLWASFMVNTLLHVLHKLLIKGAKNTWIKFLKSNRYSLIMKDEVTLSKKQTIF